MTERERMLAGKLYKSVGNQELHSLKEKKDVIIANFNDESNVNIGEKQKLLKELFKKTGNNFYIEPPFHCDYGCNITVGDNFYANFDCIFLDVNEIIIGNNVFLAPRVCIYTAGHPIDKDIRNEYLEYGYRVTIGNDVWIGGNTVINPGVNIGDNVVIGSGSVVTHDIPSNVVAAGNPCRVLRPITIADKEFWGKQKEIYEQDTTIQNNNSNIQK